MKMSNWKHGWQSFQLKKKDWIKVGKKKKKKDWIKVGKKKKKNRGTSIGLILQIVPVK